MTDPGAHWQQPTYPLAAPPPRGRRNGAVVAIVLGTMALLGVAAIVAGAVLFRHDHADVISGSFPSGLQVRPLPLPARWSSLSVQSTCGQFGRWTGTARVRNDGERTATGAFEYKLTRAGRAVGSLRGAAPQVAPGGTATVMLVSADPCTAGDRATATFRVVASV